ncbi:MAG: cupin domain-containing protein [Bacteroidota bacterium]
MFGVHYKVTNAYSITEWWIEAGGPSPAPHVHETNNELIYILEGPVSVLIGDNWQELEKGGLAVIPAGTTHTFQNKSDKKVGVLNVFMNGAYEAMMPQIKQLYADK